LAKNGKFSFKVFLLFWIIATRGSDLALNVDCPQPMRLEHVLG